MILYVEDDLIVSQLWSAVMKKAGFNIKVVTTPDEALEIVGRLPSELQAIFIDVMLPLGESIGRVESDSGLRTGFVLIEKIRRIYKDHNLPCVPIGAITIRSTYGDELEKMGVKMIFKRRQSPKRLLEVLDGWGIEPDLGRERSHERD